MVCKKSAVKKSHFSNNKNEVQCNYDPPHLYAVKSGIRFDVLTHLFIGDFDPETRHELLAGRSRKNNGVHRE